MAGLLDRLFAALGKKRHISYEEAEQMAAHPDPEVRRTIAANAAPLGQVDLKLARDADLDVRSTLARKIARLAPGLSKNEQDRLRQMTYEALDILVRDEAVRVRLILAEALKDVAQAPPEVINRLARDTEMAVAAPVLEFSPVLTDEDLLDILAGGLEEGGMIAISRRNQLRADVSDAIVKYNNVTVIAHLLKNPSAQIREETLDQIVDQARNIKQWHEPLVSRRGLSPNLMERLARFVAYNLLEILLDRKDIDLETAEEVRKEFNRRLENDSRPELVRESKPGTKKEANQKALEETSRDKARRLKQSGELDPGTVMTALQNGEREFVVAALAELSAMPAAVIGKIASTGSAKGIISVAWKSGMAMSDAVKLQRNLVRLQPRDIIHAVQGGGFPLSEDEMNWQIDFFQGLSGRE